MQDKTKCKRANGNDENDVKLCLNKSLRMGFNFLLLLFADSHKDF